MTPEIMSALAYEGVGTRYWILDGVLRLMSSGSRRRALCVAFSRPPRAPCVTPRHLL